MKQPRFTLLVAALFAATISLADTVAAQQPAPAPPTPQPQPAPQPLPEPQPPLPPAPAPAPEAAAPVPAPAASLAGEYVLTRVDETDLPALIAEEAGCRREITSATLTLGTDHQWTLKAQVRETCGETVAEKLAQQAGIFAAAADDVEFRPGEPAETEAPPTNPVAPGAADPNVIELQPINAGTIAENAIVVKYGDRQLIFRKP